MASASGPERSVISKKSRETAVQEVIMDAACRLERFAPVSVGVPMSSLKEEERSVLPHLMKAVDRMSAAYLCQISKQNKFWRGEICHDGDEKLVELFDLMYGVWDRLESNEPFWGNELRPRGVSFYPADLDREEFESYLAKHPDESSKFCSPFTVIEREPGSRNPLKAVPYSSAYSSFLRPAGEKLRDAAELASNENLKKFLELRADSFETNDYSESEIAWLNLGPSALEVVIGPYEVYEDELFGYKAAFMGCIGLRDAEESRRLEAMAEWVSQMEENLPLTEEERTYQIGSSSAPIAVVNLIYAGGESHAGVQTVALNLPNDEVVRDKCGTKKVIMKNIAEAKFRTILIPIAEQMVCHSQLEHVSFEAFFNKTLMHEIAHGLGPSIITVNKNGQSVQSTVNRELKDLFLTIEEAKADVVGMFNSLWLIEQGFFRSVRFGANDAHGIANLLQFNYLAQHGAIVRDDETGKFGFVREKFPDVIRELARIILLIEATGDYEGARELISEYFLFPCCVKEKMDEALRDVPVDIRPNFTILQHVNELDDSYSQMDASPQRMCSMDDFDADLQFG